MTMDRLKELKMVRQFDSVLVVKLGYRTGQMLVLHKGRKLVMYWVMTMDLLKELRMILHLDSYLFGK